MLLVVTISLDASNGPVQRRRLAARRTISTLARLARVHELVVVADWPDHGCSAHALVDALAEALPWHEIVLVAARSDRRGRRPGSVCNLHTVRHLLDDGAVVVCLAGGPGPDRVGPVGAALVETLPADRLVRLTDEHAGNPAAVLRSLGDQHPGPDRIAPAAPRPHRVGDPAGRAGPAGGDRIVRTGTPAAPHGW